MRRISTLSVLLFSLLLAALAQGHWHGRLSPDDQRRFDSYYERWLEYRHANNREEIISMEKRMQDVMAHYDIPASVPYEQVASPDLRGYGRWRGRLNADDQRRFDSYYQRWLEYKRTNNREEIISMEKRMRDVMAQYNIPADVPYGAIASSSEDDYYGYPNRWRGRLSDEDQRRFDSYYQRWREYRRDNDQDEVASMEGRMRDVMGSYNIPDDVPFSAVASPGLAQPEEPVWAALRILDATYGAGNRLLKVTSRLQEMIQNNSLSVSVNNETMGRDPAPETRKTLNVTYSYRGRQRRVSIPEGSTLTLP